MKEKSVVYDYISINVKKNLEPMYVDCYENFGWIVIKDNVKADYYINSPQPPNIVTLKFKRNRDISKKDELKELQKKCEKAFLMVNKLEKEPQSLATVYSLSISCATIIFVVLAILAVMSEKIMWFSAILCGTVGIAGCIFSYLIYKKVKDKLEKENKEKIEKQQDIIYDTYEKAKNILMEN